MSDLVRIPDPEPRTGILEESPGVLSSKRVMGAALIATGGLLLVSVGVVAIFSVVRDPSTVLAAGRALIIAGAALLGATVLEGIGGRG